MKKRSILAILLAALLALTIFTGCAASTKSAAMDSSAPQAPTMEAPMEESAAAEWGVPAGYRPVGSVAIGLAAGARPEAKPRAAGTVTRIS